MAFRNRETQNLRGSFPIGGVPVRWPELTQTLRASSTNNVWHRVGVRIRLFGEQMNGTVQPLGLMVGMKENLITRGTY